MSQPYIGEIRMVGFSFPPAGWADCNGQLMPISQNDALFVLLGTNFGGDGQETFGLPDIRGRFPMHQGNGFTFSEKAGTESVTLTEANGPAHTHSPTCVNANGNIAAPTGGVWAGSSARQFSSNAPGALMDPSTIGPSPGGNQPHENMSPYLVIRFIISLFGIFPHQ
jgi:microcystin-dependent protein